MYRLYCNGNLVDSFATEEAAKQERDRVLADQERFFSSHQAKRILGEITEEEIKALWEIIPE